jgi:biopolymer transport protein ExbB/TolQ
MDLVNFVSGIVIYGLQALVAIWGFFCVVLVWMRVNQKRFRTEKEQDEFLAALEGPLAQGNFGAASQMCQDDPRAVPQLAELAIANRKLGFVKVRQLLIDRFQRDVLSDLQYRLSWVNTVIKSAPMLGLLGTVVGMMGAFAKTAASGASAQPAQLADDISLALITTIVGLAIAIPLVLCSAAIHVRIGKMEEQVAAGVTRFLEIFRNALGHASEPVK